MRTLLPALAIGLLALSGCAIAPTSSGGRIAESTWVALDAVDTLQTMQLARHPACYREADPIAASVYGGSNPQASRVLLTNLALIPLHSLVARALDRKVDEANADEDGHPALWNSARIAFHVISIAATGASVANNFSRGLTPTSARCP